MIVATATLLWAQPGKFTGVFPPAAPDGSLDVIVRYKSQPNPQTLARLQAYKAAHKHHLDSIRSSAVTVPVSELGRLAADPEVESIAPDLPLKATDFNGQPDYGWMTAMNITTSRGTLSYDGTGIGVALIDSGLDDRDDLKDANGKSRIVYKQSFVPGDNNPADAYGHGELVAGIIGGTGKKSTGGHTDYWVRGIAPNVKFVNLRVLDKNGYSSDSTVIAAIQKAVALKAQYNIRIINLSLGRPISASYQADPLCQAVQQAWNAGIVVVVAAGNEGRNNSAGTNGYATILSPANSPYVITVGAMNTHSTLFRVDDTVTSYSSKGPSLIDHVVKPDIVAPGNRVIAVRDNDSTLDKEYPQNRVPVYVYSSDTGTKTPDYYQMSGTSMAAPAVSGAVALMLQKDPALTPDTIKARLMKTASKLPLMSTVAVDPITNLAYTSQNDIFTIGAGYLDIQAALASTETPTGNTMSPTAAYDAATASVHIIGAAGATWGSSALWGTSALWGSSVIWGSTSTVGGSSVIWGSTSAVGGASVIWGSNAVWGSNAASGFRAIWGSSAIWGSTTQNSAEAARVAIVGDN